ncbi:DUF885 domain-containing protein [Streptomyces regalis]|uniref:DUF885 domain-containing protein n=1 Tax=Streptomyces regalis TaxID=68262 RepID=A0A0X3UZA0_9ACTN|nr:DUF885 domain-containing protein [Streptomyces regalis]KUL37851.1 hypothetical protein ADL12_18005 [Streptomyces regalis]
MTHDEVSGQGPLPRNVADEYLDAFTQLDPITGRFLGAPESMEGLPDYSPDGHEVLADLARRTLRRLAVAEQTPNSEVSRERHCARLLRERLTADLALHESGEKLRNATNFRSPVRAVMESFMMAPPRTQGDWESVVERLTAVPAALRGYRTALAEGLSRGLPGQPAQLEELLTQLQTWIGQNGSWFQAHVEEGPPILRAHLDQAAQVATTALLELRDWLRDSYAPAIVNASDVIGRDRYVHMARFFTGANIDVDEAYAYGWSEFHRLLDEMREQSQQILPEAETPWDALGWADEHGEAVFGAEQTRRWLQQLMDTTIEELDGIHFELPEQIRRVESEIAPGGTAPYYTPPSADFERPGRTWLPVMGRTRFPVHSLVSTWYHEGVPGHHLQMAQLVYTAAHHSRYQTTLGKISANSEGWALYAERLMDELGFLSDPARRLSYLNAQMLRSMRVIIDIGIHLELPIPSDSPIHPGKRWTPSLAQSFLASHSGLSQGFVKNEIRRYQGMPGQAIGYKLGERSWLAGREAAKQRHGSQFELRRWHMAALAQPPLGLDDLTAELSQL